MKCYAWILSMSKSFYHCKLHLSNLEFLSDVHWGFNCTVYLVLQRKTKRWRTQNDAQIIFQKTYVSECLAQLTKNRLPHYHLLSKGPPIERNNKRVKSTKITTCMKSYHALNNRDVSWLNPWLLTWFSSVITNGTETTGSTSVTT